MQAVFEKIIKFIEKEIERTSSFSEHDTQINIMDYVKQEAEKLGTDNNVGSNGWIPCSEPPENDGYVLLSFENFSVPMVGRYEEDENGGSYYIGDDMKPCVTQDIFVNAWQPLPHPFQTKGE